ncbi:hypothetical protein EKO27_g8353 [Xylaria grammica]|uniref:Uncharacterized protein n=1 Tax=Xylaria grammica TaxID=363999 RepID=A0A439CXJ1_9PEZI|nr:hypothetical protein EKO27_g8353 [Xylaria grammica]
MQWSALIQSTSSSDTLVDQVVDEDQIFVDDLVFDETGVLDNSSLEITESQSPEKEIVDMSAPVHVGNPSTGMEDILDKPGQKLRGWLGPLHIAAQKGHGAIVRILMQHNTNCDERDSDGMTALMHAIIEDHEEIALSLLSNGARISILDNRRRSTLHWAALYRRESLLRALLNHHKPEIHSSINVYDSDMRTPLHTAVHSGFDAGVEMLLTFGANASLKTWKIPDGQK